MDRPVFFCCEIDVVIPPVVGEIGPNQYDVAGLKAFDMVAHELCTTAFMEKNQLHFGVIVPAVVDKRVPVFPNAKRLGRSFGDF